MDKQNIRRGRKRGAIKPERPVVGVRMDTGFNEWLIARAEAADRTKSWILKKVLTLGKQQYDEITSNGAK